MPSPAGHHRPAIPPPPALFALGGVLGGGLQFFIPWFMLPRSLPWIGIGALMLAILVSLWAILTMSRAGTSVKPGQAATALVENGPFAFSRNPIYLSMVIASLGVALLVNSVWLVLSLIPTLVVISYAVIIPEERHLTREFGHVYLRYQRRVRRWL